MAYELEAASPAMCRLYLGLELRELRQNAALTAKEVAERTSWSVPKITRMEINSSPVDPMDVRVLCQIYDAGTEKTALLEDYALVTKTKRDWWQSSEYKSLLRPGFQAFIGLEATASELHEYSSEFVPGLFQTEAYIRAIYRLSDSGHSPEEIERHVEVRLNRQEILVRQKRPVQLSVIVNEAVLRREVESPELMRGQLTHLATVARYPNVRLQVVPFKAGVHPGMSGPFIVLTFPDAAIKPIVYLENLASAGVTSKPEDVAKYERAFTDLIATALGHEASLSLIEEVRKEF
jgi:transcriptional regulator with XRE-family HTH domain